MPSSPRATAVMKGNRKRDTKPELALRSALHRMGLRYRCDYPVKLPNRRAIRADVVFTKAKVAVFCDGCYWHRCPEHGTTPKANSQYWETKLARNVRRDREVDKALLANGWVTMRIWEHADPKAAALRVAAEVAQRSSST